MSKLVEALQMRLAQGEALVQGTGPDPRDAACCRLRMWAAARSRWQMPEAHIINMEQPLAFYRK